MSFPSHCRFAACMLIVTVAAQARDAYVVLSGGGTPLTNNYSQYLQARAMAGHLQRNYPADSVWIFFGVGNREGEPAVLSDVYRMVKESGGLRDTWQPGPLKNNRPARKEEFLKALREEILPAVHDGGTLYLFIGDHGALAKAEPKESVVTMWQLRKTGTDDRSWNTDPAEELSVTELRRALDDGLGEGRVVFCMTQCHSGGFHFVGVPRAVRPNPQWFTRMVPDWAAPLDEKQLPLAAGFTAVDEESLAAGCDPDPDPDRWAGYERFVPEALLGEELFERKKQGVGLPSYAAAHEAAVLVDQTIDKPRSSSEQFLERWATTIERLAAEPDLTPKVRRQMVAYQKAVDSGLAKASGRDFKVRRTQFSRFIDRMSEQAKSAARLLGGGNRQELERAIGSKPKPGSGTSDSAAVSRPAATGARGEAMKAWKEVVRPAWQAALKAGQVRGLPPEAAAFEQYLLAQEDKGRDFMFARGWQNPMLNDLYWRSGYAFPGKIDATKAEAVTRWGMERSGKIAEWADGSVDPEVIAAAAKVWRPRGKGAPMTPPSRPLDTKIAAERVLFYRRTLAAWAFLIGMKEESALAQLSQLIKLENTPLPRPAT